MHTDAGGSGEFGVVDTDRSPNLEELSGTSPSATTAVTRTTTVMPVPATSVPAGIRRVGELLLRASSARSNPPFPTEAAELHWNDSDEVDGHDEFQYAVVGIDSSWLLRTPTLVELEPMLIATDGT